MKLFIGHRLQGFTGDAPERILLVQDALFVNCFWPKLDRPTRIFAPGSSGIKVMGRTPRNVWFPDDVEFLPYHADALYPAELAVFAAFPQMRQRRALINLGPSEAQVWWDAYNAAAEKLPPTHTVLHTVRDMNFLRHREVKSEYTLTLKEDVETSPGVILKAGAAIVKKDYEEFIAVLTPQECVDLVDGKVAESDLRAAKTFLLPGKEQKTLDQWKLEAQAELQVKAG